MHIFNILPLVCLIGFLTSKSTTRLYCGGAPILKSNNVSFLQHMRQSGETMTYVSAGHILLTPTKSVGSRWPQRGSNPEPPHHESPLYRLSYCAPLLLWEPFQGQCYRIISRFLRDDRNFIELLWKPAHTIHPYHDEGRSLVLG